MTRGTADSDCQFARQVLVLNRPCLGSPWDRNANLRGCGRKPGVCLPFQCRGELCLDYKSAFQIKQSTTGWRPQAQAAPQERLGKAAWLIPPLFWMLGSNPRDNWDCSRELGREMVSRVLLEQLVCDCHIKMIQSWMAFNDLWGEATCSYKSLILNGLESWDFYMGN